MIGQENHNRIRVLRHEAVDHLEHPRVQDLEVSGHASCPLLKGNSKAKDLVIKWVALGPTWREEGYVAIRRVEKRPVGSHDMSKHVLFFRVLQFGEHAVDALPKRSYQPPLGRLERRKRRSTKETELKLAQTPSVQLSSPWCRHMIK